MLSCFAVLVLLLLATAIQGLRLQQSAAAVRQDGSALEKALGSSTIGGVFDPAPARQQLAALQHDARQMRSLTRSWPWRASQALPGLHGSLQALTHASAAVADVSTGVLPVLTDMAVDLRSGHRSGPLDLRVITRRAVDIHAADAVLSRTLATLADDDLADPFVRSAHNQVTSQLRTVNTAVEAMATVADIGPAMTGQLGERHYLVLLQNPAEGRATGGLVGGYVELAVRSGQVRVVRSGTNDTLDSEGKDLAPVGNGFDQTWGPYDGLHAWYSSNLALNMPSVAKVWMGLYDRQFAVSLDGVIAMTPEGLGRLLALTGPLQVPGGDQITAQNAAHLFEIGLYQRFPRYNQTTLRSEYELKILDTLVHGLLRPQALDVRSLSSVSAAVVEGSLRLASSHPQEQSRLESGRIAGAMPNVREPFVAWTTQNIAGNKIDVYVDRRFTYRRHPLANGRVRVTATAVLRNDAPTSGLPAYAAVRNDLPPAERATAQVGSDKLLVGTYLSLQAAIAGVTIDGRALPGYRGEERGHPLVLVDVVLPAAGGTATVVVTADEPAWPGATTTIRQLVPKPSTYDLGP